MRRSMISALALLTLVAGCAKMPEEEPSARATAEELQRFIVSQHVEGDRGRFREVFCDVLEARGEELPDYRSCDQALRTTGPEHGATGAPVSLGPTQADYLFLLVPGLGWNCFEEWLDLSGSAPKHVAQFGFELRTVPVDGLSSTANNARMIRDYIAALPAEDAARPIILGGYSKGAPDALEAVVNYPEVAQRVVAVVSLAGAVHGSPLAMDASQAQANMLSVVPGSKCEKEDGDNAAVNSLRTDVREQWLAEHPLPEHIRYYSVATFPEAERVSWVLRNSYLLLGQTDLRNDTQLIVFDQMIPGSKVIAILNADHWAVAVPVARSHSLVGATLVDKNDYPREAFLEALMRYLEEDLAAKP